MRELPQIFLDAALRRELRLGQLTNDQHFDRSGDRSLARSLPERATGRP